MSALRSIARLGLGWLLMLAGMAMLLDSGMPASRPRSPFFPAAEALGGFVLTVAGWFLRHTATKPQGSR